MGQRRARCSSAPGRCSVYARSSRPTLRHFMRPSSRRVSRRACRASTSSTIRMVVRGRPVAGEHPRWRALEHRPGVPRPGPRSRQSDGSWAMSWSTVGSRRGRVVAVWVAGAGTASAASPHSASCWRPARWLAGGAAPLGHRPAGPVASARDQPGPPTGRGWPGIAGPSGGQRQIAAASELNQRMQRWSAEALVVRRAGLAKARSGGCREAFDLHLFS